jgi:hypothetical protein
VGLCGVGLCGRAKLTIRNLVKKFEKVDLFGIYIAIFMIKNRIIDGLHFPQFKCTFTGLKAAALCHGPHGLFNISEFEIRIQYVDMIM